MNIDFAFTTKDGTYPGAYLRDYFANDGYRRAAQCLRVEEARAILRETYLGADIDGVGVTWSVRP